MPFICQKGKGMHVIVILGSGLFSELLLSDLLQCAPFQSPSHKTKRQQQELIAELRRRQVKDNRHVYEGKDGAIEDIITGNQQKEDVSKEATQCPPLCNSSLVYYYKLYPLAVLRSSIFMVSCLFCGKSLPDVPF